MIDKLKSFWARLRVRWSVLAVALLAALPSVLDWLAVIDLRPILEHFLSPGTAGFIVSSLPFVLMFVKSAIHMSAEDTK